MGYAVHHVDGSGQTQLDDHASLDEALAEVEYPFFEVVGILCVGSASRCLQLWDRPALTVRFGELLDPPPTDLELHSNQPSIHAVVNNSLTDSGSVILSKFHLTWLIVRQIAPTKSLADTTMFSTVPFFLDSRTRID